MMTFELKTGLLSALGVHALILFNLAYWFVPNRFDIQAAPSSLEVALVSVEAPKKIEIQEEPPKVYIVKEERISDQQIKKVIGEVKSEPNQDEEKKNSQQNIISGALVEAQIKEHYNKPPIYPRVARERGYEGKLLMRVNITKEGLVDKTEVIRSSGYYVLDHSALKSVEKWQFHPAEQFGVFVDSVSEIPFEFRLDDVD